MGSSHEEAAAGGRNGDPDAALFVALRRLIEELDAEDFADLRAVGAPSGAAASASARPAVIGLTATMRRFAGLAESDSQPLRLKGLRGLAHADRLLALRAASLDQGASEPEPANVPAHRDDERAIRTIYRWSVGRVPGPSEIATWTTSLAEKANYPHFVNGMAEGEEARAGLLDPERQLTNGVFVQALFAVLLGRSPNAAEIERFRLQLRAGFSRERVALAMLRERLSAELAPDGQAASENSASNGGSVMAREEWDQRRAALAPSWREDVRPAPSALPVAAASGGSVSSRLVSVIAYTGPDGVDLRRSIEAVAADPWFAAHAELILLDDASPDDRSAALAEFAANRRDVFHWRFDVERGPARALNHAVAQARGRLLVRLDGAVAPREGGLARLAGLFESLPFADVVHPDVVYSYDPAADFAEVEAVGARSFEPLVTVHTLMSGDPLRHAPMWRKALHERVGPFDPQRGDGAELDFWFRCLETGRGFWKSSEPVGVRLLPDPGGVRRRGAAAVRPRRVMPDAILIDRADYRAALGVARAPEDEASRYVLAQRRLREVSAALNPSRTRPTPETAR